MPPFLGCAGETFWVESLLRVLTIDGGDNSLYFQASGPDLIAGCKDTTQAAASILAQPATTLLLLALIFILRL